MKALTLFLAVVLPSAAAPAQPPPSDGVQWSVGLALISSPEPYLGAENETLVIPIVTVDYKRFFFQTVRAGLHLVGSERFELELLVGVRFQGYEADDSPFLEGMDDRDPPIEVGLEAAWNGKHAGVVLGFASDLFGESHGEFASLELIKPVSVGRLQLEPKAGVEWQSTDSVDYFYGVRPAEARPGRPAYRGASTLNTIVDLEALYPLRRRLLLRGFLRWRSLGSDIEDSPIIGDSSSVTAFVALLRQF